MLSPQNHHFSKITRLSTAPIYVCSMCQRKTKSIEGKASTRPYTVVHLGVDRRTDGHGSLVLKIQWTYKKLIFFYSSNICCIDGRIVLNTIVLRFALTRGGGLINEFNIMWVQLYFIHFSYLYLACFVKLGYISWQWLNIFKYNFILNH